MFQGVAKKETKIKQVKKYLKKEEEGIEGCWMLHTLKMKVSVEGAWTVSGGRAFQSFTVCGEKENCPRSVWQAYCR